MEELTSGEPDSWSGSPLVPPVPGPVASLDLTDAITGPRTGAFSTPGTGVRDEDDPPGPVAASGTTPGRVWPRFATFVVNDADRYLDTASLLTGDRDRAEELLRHALARAGAGWARHRGTPEAAVLRALARALTGPLWWRPHPPEFPADPTGAGGGLDGPIGSRLARLDRRHQVAVVLHFHQHCSEDETAAALGAPVGNVRSWLSQALDQLEVTTRLDTPPPPTADLSADPDPDPGPDHPGQDHPGHPGHPGQVGQVGQVGSVPHRLNRAGLSAELTRLAAQIAPSPGPPARPTAAPVPVREPGTTAATDQDRRDALRLNDRLTAVRARLPAQQRRERRRRVLAGAGIGAVVVAVIAGLLVLAGPVPDPVLAGGTGDPGASATASTVIRPPVSRRSADPTRFVFRPAVAGDPLLAARVGQRGQTTLTVRFTAATTSLSFSAFCHTWAENGPQVEVTLNGDWLTTEDCGAEARANANLLSRDDYPRTRSAGWSGSGVRAGKESVLRMRLVSDELDPAGQSQVRLGVAVYELSGPRLLSDGVVIKKDLEQDDVQYHLSGYGTATISKARRSLTVSVPAGTSPALVQVGLPDSTSDSEATMQVTVDGTDAAQGSSGGVLTFTLPDAGAHTLRIAARPDDTGALLLAWYQSSDEPVK